MVEVQEGGRPNSVTSDEEKKSASSLLDVKHLLENNWTLWFFRNDRNRQWEDNQVQVATFGTVEDFWALYNHVESAGRLPVGCDYSLFKEGIKPAWEDERNRSGGRWLLQVERGHKADTDRYWMEVLMMLIGEAFENENDVVCGAVVSVRQKQDRIAVWLGCDISNDRSIMKIGEIIKDRLKLPARSLTYQTHTDTSSKSGSNIKTTFSL